MGSDEKFISEYRKTFGFTLSSATTTTIDGRRSPLILISSMTLGAESANESIFAVNSIIHLALTVAQLILPRG
jgi:hypothetical protein